MKQAQQQLLAANENVAKIEANLKPAKEQQSKLAGQVATLESAIQSAAESAQRWQNEIEFVQQLKQLNERLEAAKAVVLKRQSALEDANAKLSAAQSSASVARGAVDDATAAVQSILVELARAKNIDK